MNKQEAFKIVYNELTKRSNLFCGKFDSKNGSFDFMLGIELVMEYIAYEAGHGQEYEGLFERNFSKSLQRRDENACQ